MILMFPDDIVIYRKRGTAREVEVCIGKERNEDYIIIKIKIYKNFTDIFLI